MRQRRNYSYLEESKKRNDDRFYEAVEDQRRFYKNLKDKQTKEYDNPFEGPNGISAKITREQIARSKRVPVTLPKMSWEK
jgi:hypothetical protein